MTILLVVIVYSALFMEWEDGSHQPFTQVCLPTDSFSYECVPDKKQFRKYVYDAFGYTYVPRPVKELEINPNRR